MPGVAAAGRRGSGCGKKGPPLAPFVRVPALVTDGHAAARRQRRLCLVRRARDQRRRTEAGGHRRGRGLRGHVGCARPPPRSSASWRRWSRRCRCRPILPPLPMPADGSAPPPLPVPPGRRSRSGRRDSRTADRRGARRRWSCRWRQPVVAAETPIDETRPSGSDRWWRRRQRSCRSGTTSSCRSVRAGGRACRRRRCRCRSKPAARRRGAGGDAHRERDDDHLAAVARRAHVDVRRAARREAGGGRQRRRRPTSTPKAPPPLPPLPAKSLGFNTQATTYHLYDVTAATSRRTDPYAIALPKPLTPAAGRRARVRDQGRGVRRRALLRSAAGRPGVRRGGDRPGVAAHLRDAEGHVPAGGADDPCGDRRRGRHQPDLGSQHRERSGRLPRVARRGAR